MKYLKWTGRHPPPLPPNILRWNWKLCEFRACLSTGYVPSWQKMECPRDELWLPVSAALVGRLEVCAELFLFYWPMFCTSIPSMPEKQWSLYWVLLSVVTVCPTQYLGPQRLESDIASSRHSETLAVMGMVCAGQMTSLIRTSGNGFIVNTFPQ